FMPAKAELHGLIAIVGRGLNLRHHAGAGLDHGNRDRHACRAEDLGHAHLAAQHSTQHLFAPAARETRRWRLVASRRRLPCFSAPRARTSPHLPASHLLGCRYAAPVRLPGLEPLVPTPHADTSELLACYYFKRYASVAYLQLDLDVHARRQIQPG